MNDQARPVCSVCIANYNGKEYIDRCLKSIQEQDCPFPLEILLHDDASTDGSAEYIRENYPGVILVESKKNVGFCVSNNRMVARARGEYILLLNNDAELFHDAVRTLYTEALSQRKRAILGLPQYEASSGSLLDFGSFFDPFLNPTPNLNPCRREVGMVTGACLWLPRTLWDELGGFPEWFQSLAEDTYLCCLARLKGYPVLALCESGFNHWVGKSLGGGKVIQSTLQTTYRRRALSERNKSYVMLLCYPGPLAYVLIPLHLLLLTIEGWALTIAKRDRRIWSDVYKSCLKALWSSRQKVVRLRRKIQASREVSSRSFFSVHSILPRKLTLLLKHGLPIVQ